MNYCIEKGSVPSYLQLYNRMKNDIVSGIYGYGTKLPSKRLLAEESGLSTITVEHAYLLLCDEGYAEARERSGYFVIFRPNDGFAFASDRVESKKQFDNAMVAKPSFPYSVLSRAMRRVISSYDKVLLEKSPNSGLLELRTALKNYLARNRRVNISVDQIVIGSGSEYLYGLIIELLGRDRKVAIESPSYNKIEKVYSAAEISYDELSLTKDGIDSKSLSETNASILHTTPYRSYPSGVTASASKRHEYIRWASVDGRYLIEDDFESEFSVSTKPMETLFSLSSNDNVIYMNTFSKTISPGIRVAYMVLPMHLATLFESKLGFYSCTVPTFEQYLLAELIDGGEFERHINRVRRSLRKDSQA